MMAGKIFITTLLLLLLLKTGKANNEEENNEKNEFKPEGNLEKSVNNNDNIEPIHYLFIVEFSEHEFYVREVQIKFRQSIKPISVLMIIYIKICHRYVIWSQ